MKICNGRHWLPLVTPEAGLLLKLLAASPSICTVKGPPLAEGMMDSAIAVPMYLRQPHEMVEIRNNLPEKTNVKLEFFCVALVPLLQAPIPEVEEVSTQSSGGPYSIRGSDGSTTTVLIVFASEPSSRVWPDSSLEILWTLCWLTDTTDCRYL